MSGYLYKKLGNFTLIQSRLFPYTLKNYIPKGSIALIGVGGNLGDVLRRFNHLFFTIERKPHLKILATSTILKNPPFGYLDQPDFYNTLLLIETTLTPMQLLKRLQKIEFRFRRKRLFKDAPRTLDLDIILFNKERIRKAPVLIIPHPHYRERISVLQPLESLKGVKWLKRVL